MGEAIKIGITGLPNSGKTQALLKVIAMLEEKELTVGGMLTKALIENKRRVGFSVIDWRTKESGVLAHVDFESKIAVGRYKVDLEALEAVGVKSIIEATEDAEIIIIDEIGKMEVESEAFVKAVRDAMEIDKPMILTLHKKSRNPLLQDIRRRDDVRILEVTPVNRNLLPYKIVNILKGAIF